MFVHYILKSIKHSGRKGIRGTDCTDPKYKGLVGYQCRINVDDIKQFKSYQFDIFSPIYDWWRTSEVLQVVCSVNNASYLEIETVNAIYTFERIENETK